MDAFTCSPSTSVHQYLMMLDDQLMARFLMNNRLIQSCALKCCCRIFLDHKILNRSIRPGIWSRYFIVNVMGKDHFTIERCNRLIERHIPQYRKRERYRCRSNVRLYTTEWTPDNTQVSEASMRMGPQRSRFGNLHIFSPFANDKYRPHGQTPWKITAREKVGHYEFPDIYRPILAKSLPIYDYPVMRFTSYKDIVMFRWPNTFDRYTTFKAIDNEYINKKLQRKCARYLEAMKNGNSGPIANLPEPETRQSSKFVFEKTIDVAHNLLDEGPVTNTKLISYTQIENRNIRSEHSFEASIYHKPNTDGSMFKHKIDYEFTINSNADLFQYDPVMVEDVNAANNLNQSNLILNRNQNFAERPHVTWSSDLFQRLMETRDDHKAVRPHPRKKSSVSLNRWMRLRRVRVHRKCINYTALKSRPILETDSEEATIVSSDRSVTKDKLSTRASKSSNLEGDTLDSLRSF